MVDDTGAARRHHLTSPEAATAAPPPPPTSWWPSKASPAGGGPPSTAAAAAAAPSPSRWRPWGSTAAPSPTPSGRHQPWESSGGLNSAPWSAASSPRRVAQRWGGAPQPPHAHAHPPPFDPSSDLASHVATVVASIVGTVRTMRSAALLAGSALGGTACFAGWVLLLSLLATRSFAPPAAVVTRDLWVDYTASPATGVASFLPDPAAAALVAAAAQEAAAQGKKATTTLTLPRAFPAGRRLDVWLAMEAPDVDARGGGGGAAGDVFQVRAELLAPDGRVLAAASRPALLPPRSRAARALRSAALAPLVVLGLADELRTLRIPLFSGYRDRPDAPFVALRIALAGRVPAGASPAAGPGAPPALAAVRGIVSQRLGLARRLLYYVRPGDALAWPLFALAAAAIAGGGAAAALCGLGWALTAGWVGGRGGRGGSGAGEDDAVRPPWEAAGPSGAATPSIAGTEDGGPGAEDESWDGGDGEWAAQAGPDGREASVVISSSSDDGDDEAASISSSTGEEEDYVDSVPGSPVGGSGGAWADGLRRRGGG